MTGKFLHEGAGPVYYMGLLGQRGALRVSLAETCLTLYRCRVFSEPEVIFRFYFCDFSGVANLFWL